MLDIELVGELPPGFPSNPQVDRLCAIALASAGVRDGHLAIEIVDAERIADLNARYPGKAGPTDVLSFPVDADTELAPGDERELGDVVVCPAHTADLLEAVVHGVLHLVGMDHETDLGEMLSLQRAMLGWERAPDAIPLVPLHSEPAP